MLKKIMFLVGYCMLTFLIRANNIQVSNISVVNDDYASRYAEIQFDINWSNSWRLNSGPANWDAAWVFVKYRVSGGPWLHAFLNNTGHSAGTGTSTTIAPGLLNTSSAFNSISNPAMGVFIHRSSNGVGNFSQTGIRLRWNYGANSIIYSDAIDISVFAIEMVYVPSGSFQLGDGSTTTAGQFRDASVNTPFNISSENALTLGGTTLGNLGNNNGSGMVTVDDFNNATTQSLPPDFPKGFAAFYCMKYEMSQQNYIDFFNTLNNTQKATRDITGTSSAKNTDALLFRNNISWTSGDATLNGGTYGDVACNFIRWGDGTAFADWACLRPMSELEYEKACRGTENAVPNELAWGNTTPTLATGISNVGNNNEVASNTNANVNLGAITGGPLRVGSFATSTADRIKAGATFYGIMEMSGNLHERTVSVGRPQGRQFTRNIHGNGLLGATGNSDIITWPAISGSGANFRGGDWGATTANCRVSERNIGNLEASAADQTYGFRAVRTAP